MKIRREHENAFAELQRKERRARLAAEIVAGDDKARIDEKGNIVLEDSRGNQSVLELTDQGIAGLRTAGGRRYHLDRDQTGRIVRIADPINQTVEINYTPEGPVGEIHRNGKRMLSCEYAKEGDTLVATFADGAREHLEYHAGQLVRTVDANGAENRFVRNQELQVIEVVDPNGHSTRFDYDEDGNPLRRVLPDGWEESYEEDDDGNFIVKVNGRPWIRIMADESGDNERADFADGHFVAIKWDGDKPVQGVNEYIKVTFEYDGKGSPVKETQDDLAIEYEYDGEENLVTIKTSDNEKLRFHYDGDDLLIGITDWSGRKLTFSHDKVGSTTGIRFPNGVTTGATVYSEGHYASIETISPVYTNEPVVSERYAYDGRDRLISRAVPDNEWRYTYDPAGQLITCGDASGAIEAFSYDAAGNLIRNRLGDAHYDACNRILSAGAERFEHDEHGNLVRCQGSCNEFYRYNDQGHLLEIRDAQGQTVKFAYDAFGRRIRKQCGNTTTHFLWAGRQLLREWTESDGRVVERRDYVFIPGEGYPIAVRINGEPYYYHADRLGTPLALTDPSGTVVWKAEYSPFGEARILVEKVRQPLRFLGQYCDAETGLHYNVFRYYDPTLGRYLTPDPLRYGSGSTNLYQYSHNDPINRRDPDGLIVPLVALGIIAGAALVGGLIGGAIGAATAPPGERANAFAKGFGWGALGGAVGAAVPIIGAVAGLGAGAIAAIGVGADAVVGGIEACATEGGGVGTFLKGAGIAAATTIATLGLSKIPGVKRALGAVGKRLGAVANKALGKITQKLKPRWKVIADRFDRKIADKIRRDIAQRTKNTPNHIRNHDPSVPRRRGIGGVHNQDEFNKALTQEGGQVVKHTPHSTIPGVERVEYKLAALDRTGHPSGTLQAKSFEKTIYDPKLMPDNKVVKLGKEAAADAASKGQLTREWTGTAQDGTKMRGYLDDQGNISSFFFDF